MARFLGFLFSLMLHLTVVVAAIWAFEHTEPPGAKQPKLEQMPVVELVSPPEPQQPRQAQKESRSAKEQRQQKVFDVLERASLPHERYTSVKLISPRKVDIPNRDVEIRDDIFFGTGFLKQGNEVRLSLRSLRAVEFTTKDFVGRYQVQGEKQVIEVQKLENGRLLFIDHDTGMRRLLHKKGKFIYTYGPDYDQEKPVAGSITFLPHERKALDLPSRIMWLPEKPPMIIGAMEGWPELSKDAGAFSQDPGSP